MNAIDVLRKEAHELMNLVQNDPNNILVMNNNVYNERLALCVDGDLSGYIHSFKSQIRQLHGSVEYLTRSLNEITEQCKEIKKQNEGLTITIEETNKMLNQTEHKFYANQKTLEDTHLLLQQEREKSSKLISIIAGIQKALCNTDVIE